MYFLSEEWIRVAGEALRSDSAFLDEVGEKTFCMWIVAEEKPEWADDATLTIEDGDISLVSGQEGVANAVGRAKYQDWLAILRHELHPRRATLTRKLRGKGLPAVLTNYRLLDTMLDALRTIEVTQ